MGNRRVVVVVVDGVVSVDVFVVVADGNHSGHGHGHGYDHDLPWLAWIPT